MSRAIPGSHARGLVQVKRRRRAAVSWAYTALIWLAFLAVWATAAIPERVESEAEAARIGFGYPVDFLYVDNWRLGAVGGTGQLTVARPNPWEDDIHIRADRFLLDWAMFGLLLSAPLAITRRLRG